VPRYLLDANVFIKAYRSFYTPKIAPTFWEKLGNVFINGSVCTMNKVYDEILEGKDWLASWLKEIPSNKILTFEDDKKAVDSYANLVSWVQTNNKYRQVAKDEFLNKQKADSFLISFTLGYEDIVLVTFESYHREKRKKMLLPNICEEIGLSISPVIKKGYYFPMSFNFKNITLHKCISLFEMMALLDIKL